jgi:hypothetical protein
VKPWPAAAIVSWYMGTNLVDAAGNSLAASYVGAFRTVVPEGGGWPTNDATVFVMERTDGWVQTGPDTLVREPGASHAFAASVQMGTNRAPESVHLVLPATSAVELTPDFLDRARYVFEDASSDTATFEGLYPEGVYRFRVGEGGLVQEVLGLLPGPPVSVPRLLDYAGAQSVIPNRLFVVTWDLLQDGTASDHVRVAVEGTAVHSPGLGEPGALDGTAVSWAIPAGALAPSNRYNATLTLTRFWANTNAGEAYGVQAVRVTTTRFALMTVGAAAAGAPELFGMESLGDGTVRFRVTADPESRVTVEGSATLQPESWTPVLTNAAGGEFEVLVPAGAAHGFFRVRSP